jgi:hypothetical protein
VIPGDQEVLDFGAAFPGEPSSGAPMMPKAFVEKWLARMNARSGGWPLDWKRALVAEWRKEFRTWGKGGNTKSGGAFSVLDLKTRKQALDEQIAKHPANPEGAGWGEPSPEEEEEFDVLKAERRTVEKQLAMGGSND